MKKHAGVWGHVVLPAAAAMGTAAVMAPLLNAATTGIQGAIGRLQEGKNYAKMMAANPELTDDVNTRHTFNTLHSVAPTLAKDPYFSGKFLNHMQNTEGGLFNPTQVKNLVEADRAMTQAGSMSSQELAMLSGRSVGEGIHNMRAEELALAAQERQHAMMREGHVLKGQELRQRTLDSAESRKDNLFDTLHGAARSAVQRDLMAGWNITDPKDLRLQHGVEHLMSSSRGETEIRKQRDARVRLRGAM